MKSKKPVSQLKMWRLGDLANLPNELFKQISDETEKQKQAANDLRELGKRNRASVTRIAALLDDDVEDTVFLLGVIKFLILQDQEAAQQQLKAELSRRASRAARHLRRVKNWDSTRLFAFRSEWVEKHGTERGWKKAAIAAAAEEKQKLAYPTINRRLPRGRGEVRHSQAERKALTGHG
jgi:hypothetical protein